MIVDAHHHFWNLERVAQPWLTDEHAAIARTFEPPDLEPMLAPSGIEQTVLVQSASLDADTDYAFEHAEAHAWIGGVVAWVPLGDPARTRERLEELTARPKLRGVRNLIHEETDAHWILRPPVLESLELVAEHGLVLELPVVFPRHLDDVPELARSFPSLTIVIDHLGKPPLGTAEMTRWAAGIRAAADSPNVAAKISGLNTALRRPDWDADDLREAVTVAVECFGPERLLCGSDWPVALLNGSYARVWDETVRVVQAVAPQGAGRILRGTARRLYRLEDQSQFSRTADPGDIDGRAH